MAKVDYRNLSKKQRQQLLGELLGTFSRLGLGDNGRELLTDLLTESEVTMLARRIIIARRLLAGHSIAKIACDLNASQHTIQSVDQWLDTKFNAYRNVLPPFFDEQREKHKKKKTKKVWIPADPYSLRWLRKQYPSRFGLLNLLLGDPEVYEVEE